MRKRITDIYRIHQPCGYRSTRNPRLSYRRSPRTSSTRRIAVPRTRTHYVPLEYRWRRASVWSDRRRRACCWYRGPLRCPWRRREVVLVACASAGGVRRRWRVARTRRPEREGQRRRHSRNRRQGNADSRRSGWLTGR